VNLEERESGLGLQHLPTVLSETFRVSLAEGFRESKRCSRDTYPESYITEETLVYEENPTARISLQCICLKEFATSEFASRNWGHLFHHEETVWIKYGPTIFSR